MKLFFLLLVSLPGIAEDWKVPTNAEALNRLKAVLGRHTGDHMERRVTRTGNQVLEFEGIVSTEANKTWVAKILEDLESYPRWVLKKINDKPTGGKYYVQLMNLTKMSDKPPILKTNVTVALPLFKKNLVAQFDIRTVSEPDVVSWHVNSLPDDKSVVDWANAVVKVFPVPNASDRVWIYMKAGTKVRNWLLYEALPEKMLVNETVERLGILLSNYLQEEDNRISATPKNRTPTQRAN